MTWTIIKTTIVVGTGALLLIGITAITGCKKETATATTAKESADTPTPEVSQTDESVRDSWLTQDLTPAMVVQSYPQVRILPTRFSEMHVCGSRDLTKWGGIDVPVSVMVRVAYQWSQGRIVFSGSEPSGRYDFIASLPDGACEALQRELREQFGLVGRRETRDADVLVLKVRTPNAPGLRPPLTGGHKDFSRRGQYICDDRPLATDIQPFVGLQRFLESYFNTPVVDETELTNHYRMVLNWNERGPDDPNHEALKQALRNQLGLELVPGRRSIEMLVVEQAR